MPAIEDTLANVELFADLSPEDLSRLAKLTIVRDYKKGDIIVRENEAGVAFYIIAKGSVEVVKGLGTGNEQVLARLGEGSFFGEMALFENQVRSSSVRAAEDCQCLVMAKWDFNAELLSNGRIALAMLAVLARRIRQLNEAVTH
ncbi:MAG TPA: cyclic nucleotide-binding domain-containing protein [Dehalococcoidia bacterium]|jgi:CRP/FNR family cyclic AMP-dependent transcriptional regulator|nr:cyclic nucleotide-binding domain-containing protein [Dehalococcoidia bacterium]